MSTVTTVTVRCDRRGCKSVFRRNSNRAGAREWAVERAGWLMTGGKDWCPQHLELGREAQRQREFYDRIFVAAGLKNGQSA